MDQKKVYPVEDVQKGDYMVWSVCSQAERNALVVLRDDKTVYATIKKTSHSTELQDLTNGLKAASTEEVETCVLKSPSMTLPIPSMAASR